MYRRIFSLFMICSLCLLAAACEPSDEKIDEARQKYALLAEVHNKVVEAHKDVEDDSLDESLTEIREQISEVESYNLAEMKDEEIDALIQTMDSLIVSYESALDTLSDIKEKEEAAVLVPIPVSVENETGFSVVSLKLYEKGDYGTHVNVLEGMDGLAPKQALAGLMIQKDADSTPWILVLSDSEGKEYELEIPVSEYGEDGITLRLVYDAAYDALTIEYKEKAEKFSAEE